MFTMNYIEKSLETDGPRKQGHWYNQLLRQNEPRRKQLIPIQMVPEEVFQCLLDGFGFHKIYDLFEILDDRVQTFPTLKGRTALRTIPFSEGSTLSQDEIQKRVDRGKCEYPSISSPSGN